MGRDEGGSSGAARVVSGTRPRRRRRSRGGIVRMSVMLA